MKEEIKVNDETINGAIFIFQPRILAFSEHKEAYKIKQPDITKL